MGKRCIFKASQLVSNCWHPASLERQGKDGSQGAVAAAPTTKSPPAAGGTETPVLAPAARAVTPLSHS